MFHVLGNEPECSQCGSTDSEDVWHNHQNIRRCRNCGHEAVVAEITTNNETTWYSWTYEKPSRPSF